ncbi:27322_t:CDS:1, partial [Gigaspora margarita]
MIVSKIIVKEIVLLEKVTFEKLYCQGCRDSVGEIRCRVNEY